MNTEIIAARRPANLRRVAVAAAALAFMFGAVSCSEKTKDSASSDVQSAASDVKEAAANVLDNATETAVRNIATRQGEQQFADTNNELDGSGLTCEAKLADGLAHVTVSCTGTTKDGKAAALTGETSEIPGASVTELEGDFTGTADGNEVFTTKRLGA